MTNRCNATPNSPDARSNGPACNHLIRIPNPPAGVGFTHVQPESGQTWATHVPKGNKT